MKRTPLVSAILLVLASCSGNLLLQYMNEAPTTTDYVSLGLRGIWIVGGMTSAYQTSYPYATELVGQLDLYDPETDTWYPAVTTLPVPVTFAGVVAYQGKIYVTGGWDTKGRVRDIMQVYDIQTGTWSEGLFMPRPRAAFELVAIDGYLYATAGQAVNQEASYNSSISILRYDTINATWQERGNFNYPEGVIVSFGGMIHSMGGRGSSSNLQNYHERLIPNPLATDAASGTAEISATRIYSAADAFVAKDGSAFVLLSGGLYANLGGTTHANLFNFLTNTPATTMANSFFYLKIPFEAPMAWLNFSDGNLSSSRAFHRMVVYGNKAFLFGGTTTLPTPTASSDTIIIDLSHFPTSGSQSVGAPMPVARFGHKAVRNIE